MAGRLVLCMLVCPGEICTGMPLAFDLCSAAHARSTDVAGDLSPALQQAGCAQQTGWLHRYTMAAPRRSRRDVDKPRSA